MAVPRIGQLAARLHLLRKARGRVRPRGRRAELAAVALNPPVHGCRRITLSEHPSKNANPALSLRIGASAGVRTDQRTCSVRRRMSAFGTKADIAEIYFDARL